jgi:hypothetical protein
MGNAGKSSGRPTKIPVAPSLAVVANSAPLIFCR